MIMALEEEKGKPNILLPPKPLAPQPSDCCGTGCCPCVHDIYEQDLKSWKARCEKVKKCDGDGSNISTSHDAISKDVYTDFEIIDIKEITNNTFIYKFSIPNKNGLGMKVGQHLVVQQIKDGRSISRQYTPISDVSEDDYFDVLIKIYVKGKLTQIVKNWKMGNVIPWRGPFGDFIYIPNKYQHILMIAAGTGIAPMYQIICSVLKNDEDETILSLLYSSKSFVSILLRDELLELESYWNFSVAHYLSEETSMNGRRYKENVTPGRLKKNYLKEKVLELKGKVKDEKLKILICGTKSFDKDMINACKDAELADDFIFKF